MASTDQLSHEFFHLAFSIRPPGGGTYELADHCRKLTLVPQVLERQEPVPSPDTSGVSELRGDQWIGSRGTTTEETFVGSGVWPPAHMKRDTGIHDTGEGQPLMDCCHAVNIPHPPLQPPSMKPHEAAMVWQTSRSSSQVAEALQRYIASGGNTTEAGNPQKPIVPVAPKPAGHIPCPICPLTSKMFGTEKALEQHLESGVHARKSRDAMAMTEKVIFGGAQAGGATNNGGWRLEPRMPTAVKVPSPPAIPSAIDVTIQEISAAISGTAIFSDQMLLDINITLPETQVLVISATRTLAIHVISALADNCKSMGITTYATVGGTVIRDDKVALARGPHIVSGTPGRVMDMIKRQVLGTKCVTTLVLNKEKLLLGRSLGEQLTEIYRALGSGVKVVRAAIEESVTVQGMGSQEVVAEM